MFLVFVLFLRGAQLAILRNLLPEELGNCLCAYTLCVLLSFNLTLNPKLKWTPRMIEILKQNESNILDIVLEANMISVGTLSIQIIVHSPHRSQIGSMKWNHRVFCQFQPFQMLGSHSRLGASQMPSDLPLLPPLPVLLLCGLVLSLQTLQVLPNSWPLYLVSLWSRTVFT